MQTKKTRNFCTNFEYISWNIGDFLPIFVQNLQKINKFYQNSHDTRILGRELLFY